MAVCIPQPEPGRTKAQSKGNVGKQRGCCNLEDRVAEEFWRGSKSEYKTDMEGVLLF